MKANELRIGNLVKDQSYKERIWQVIGVSEKVIDVRGTDTIAEHPQLIEYILPIPLTEEWLLKFGFEQGRNHAGWVLLKDSSIGDYVDENVLFEFFQDAYDHIQYVHQLQNLYFALTGEELSVNP